MRSNNNDHTSTQNIDSLRSDYDSLSSAVNDNKVSERENFDCIQTEQNLYYNNRKLQNNTYGNLTNCENIQFGPRIITSNLTVIESKGSSTTNINCVNINGEDYSKKVFSENKGIYCKIGCTKTKINFMITSGLILIFILIASTCIIILLNLYDENNFRESNNANSDIIESKNDTQWLISYKEWSGKDQSNTCTKRLSTVDKIMFWFMCGRCETYNYCQHELKWDLLYDKKYCEYEDLSYHYALSEHGLIFEGRSMKCEIPPEFKECNKSVIMIKVFLSNDSCDFRCDLRKIQKQFSNLNELIKYNQNNGVLSKQRLSASTHGVQCHEKYIEELKRTLDIAEVEYLEHKILCIVDTCKHLNLFNIPDLTLKLGK